MKIFVALYRCLGIALLSLACSASLWAGDLLMVRSQLSFQDAQPRLEKEINSLGYFSSDARKIDVDLVGAGFSSGTYRAISYGRPGEIKKLIDHYPELTPFLPPQIVLFGERKESLLVALNPLYLAELFPQPELTDLFNRWYSDLQTILGNLRDAR